MENKYTKVTKGSWIFRLLFSARKSSKAIDLLQNSGFFDDKFYSTRYQVKGGIAAISHYLSVGWKFGFDPSARFSTLSYLKLNPDVAAAGINPLEHYIRHGRYENRRIWEDGQLPALNEQSARDKTLPLSNSTSGAYRYSSVEAGLLPKLRHFFSSSYYLSNYVDVNRAGSDPLTHYLEHGWKEDRNPSERFDTKYYLSKFPELAQLNICPLLHYINSGADDEYGAVPIHRIVVNPNNKTAEELSFWSDSNIKIGVHAHVFFPELIFEMHHALKNLPKRSHVRFTTVTEGDRRYVNNVLRSLNPEWGFDVVLAERSGRDIGPLFRDCVDLWRSCDLMLHIHTKRSLHTAFGNEWRRYLYDQCLGSTSLLDQIFSVFASSPDVAMMFPDNFYEIKKFVGLNGNEAALEALCHAISPSKFRASDVSEFPAGSMAWFRTKAYLQLVDHLTSYDAFGGEERVEGTMAHVIERAFSAIPLCAGLQIRSYSTPTRVALDYRDVARGMPVYFDDHSDKWPRDNPRIALAERRALAPSHSFFNSQSLNIHWIIPSFGPGAGGHMTIFRFVEFFEKFGHRQTVWIQNANNYRTPADAKKLIMECYRPIGENVFVRFLPTDLNQLSGDVLIATDCWTAYPAAAATRFKERFYFIQDYESQFHAAGTSQLIAELTYKFEFAALCAGPWLLAKAVQYGMWARQWNLAVDRVHYFPPVQRRKAKKDGYFDIAFYSRTNTPRRAVDLGVAGFECLARMGYKFRVHFFGGEELITANGYEACFHGIITPEKLGALYRVCDFGVVFSATNYSLIPLEMMACGLPVVELNVESVRAVFNSSELLMVEPTPPAVAAAMKKLIESEDLRIELGLAGVNVASRYDWEFSARSIEGAIVERLQDKSYKSISPSEVCLPHKRKVRKASVFVPVKDGGPLFEQVIDRILSQETDFEYDFLVIDSGSSDGTLELLKRKSVADSRFRFKEIPQVEFQHGRTRNLGIEGTDGEYVAITTADALPADQRWLANLVRGFQKSPLVAGVTGRHLPHPGHGPFLARDMKSSFDNFRNLSDVYGFGVSLASQIYPGGQEWQMITQFYSDNNSAMSREVWKVLPYPEIDWGEDMVWAWEAIKLGFHKAYVDDAIVFHSHEWDLKSTEAWYAVEGRFWKQSFGFDIVRNYQAELADWNVRDRVFAIMNKVSNKQLERQLSLNAACLGGRARGASESSE